MTKAEFAIKIENNKKKLSDLMRKKINIEVEINNLQKKIQNQENYLLNMKEGDTLKDKKPKISKDLEDLEKDLSELKDLTEESQLESKNLES